MMYLEEQDKNIFKKQFMFVEYDFGVKFMLNFLY